MKNFIISQAPHIHSDNTTRKLMRDVIIALLPAALVSVYFMGFPVLYMILISIGSAVLFEYLIKKFVMKTKPTVNDLSAVVTGLLLGLNLPPATPLWVVIIGSFVAIAIAKMTFGGLGQNIWNPALVGRVFLLISFPVFLTNWSYDIPSWISSVDAFSGATPLGLIKEGLAGGSSVQDLIAANPQLSNSQMFLAKSGGSAGEVSAIALILGFIYLLIRKVIKPHITLSILVTVFVFSGIFWLSDPTQYMDPIFNLLSGGLLLGSIFMATDYVTSPMNPKAQIVYGVGIGVLTVLIRLFGSYPEGVSFAILIMNSIVPLLNKYMKPKRFGRVK
ncbi:MAG: RnfABCDGE type electron transport complex subunit D [Bacteroidales bacterium]